MTITRIINVISTTVHNHISRLIDRITTIFVILINTLRFRCGECRQQRLNRIARIFQHAHPLMCNPHLPRDQHHQIRSIGMFLATQPVGQMRKMLFCVAYSIERPHHII